MERWSNKRKTKDEQNKGVLRQNYKRDIKENGCRERNTILMDISLLFLHLNNIN